MEKYLAGMSVKRMEDITEALWGSHLPLRRRERAMSRFRRMSKLQKFVSTHASFHNHFNLDRHLNPGSRVKENRDAALSEWRGLLSG